MLGLQYGETLAPTAADIAIFPALGKCLPMEMEQLHAQGSGPLRLETPTAWCTHHGLSPQSCYAVESVCQLSFTLVSSRNDGFNFQSGTREDLQSRLRHHRGNPWDPEEYARVGTQYESSFFAKREGHRLFAEEKLRQVTAGTALNGGWMSEKEAEEWRVYFSHGNLDMRSPLGLSSPMVFASQGNVFTGSSYKLLHDAEQMTHLILQGKLPSVFWTHVQACIDISETYVRGGKGDVFVLSLGDIRRIGNIYQSHVYVPPPPRSLDRALTLRSFDQSKLSEISVKYHSEDIVVIDNFFTQPALDALREFCLEATVFFDIKNGYLGAYHTNGLDSPVLYRAIDEMRSLFPSIIGDQVLRNMWAYKYSDRGDRLIAVHGDDAAVNLNIWLNPDYDVDPADGGGLVIWTTGAPSHWSFDEMNRCHTARCKEMVGRSANVTVPFKQNRLVMFKSSLFHASQHFTNIAQGYRNRRINLTFLFGHRGANNAANRDG